MKNPRDTNDLKTIEAYKMADAIVEKFTSAQGPAAISSISTPALVDLADDIAGLLKRNADRKERIATAALQGMLASDTRDDEDGFAECAVGLADALISKLDEG